jgi:hypothetical protein
VTPTFQALPDVRGLVQNWGCQCVPDIFAPVLGPGAGRGVDFEVGGSWGRGSLRGIMEISKPDDLGDIVNLGLTLTEAKQLLARVQREISTAQAREHAVRRPVCPCRDGICRVKDYRDHAVSMLFGQVTLRLPRFRCAACGRIETGINWPSHCRSTPELDRLRAHLSAPMTYRVSTDLLEYMFPVDAGIDPRTLRRHTLKTGAALADRAAIRPPAAAPAITVTVDSTFIRSREDGERRFEVRVGNVETKAGGRQVFGGVAKAETDIEGLIRKNLDAVGGTGDTALTAFTDGCPGLRGILADAGVLEPPILDWFHIAMRLQHLKQIGDGLAAGDPARAAAKAVIVTEVERLHWRIWNGKAKNAGKSIDRIRAVIMMYHFRGERDSRKSIAPSRKLWTALRALNRYLIGQSAWLVNYAERHRAGLRVGTGITEGTANFLVNRRMNKSQQMRWSRHGADLLLQVRCAVYNGTLGSEFGQKFHPANDSFPPAAVAA